MKQAEEGLNSFLEGGGDMEFDGGDSGGGVVGDGNMDLEDQHNSAEMLRGGFLEEKNLEDIPTENIGQVKSAMDSRVASAGANYFGRTTGYAEKLIANITDEQRRTHRMDEVRAQQIENWHNQRQIHKTREGRQTGEAYGQPVWEPTIIKRNVKQPAGQRRDGQDWGDLKVDPSKEPSGTYELKTNIDSTAVVEIRVDNEYMTFAPYRCAFTSDSHYAFSVAPDSGTMNRRGKDPVELVVRFSPREPVSNATATLVFDTEDFTYTYKFFGST
eukprot:CAMPEP_0184751658 /NCGR_PEP_ID=MMETSP0315-20130426/43158_1 /TAXON_ID=101924 /ORGANISM="Rhodosorus marinus, Strain UTEX LB 2760" /LENGTH=271 /DNA_ID=CAMNT_0027230935 /DNA_START=340 /DNA_END=1155 /DNA_ORIENTATION=+